MLEGEKGRGLRVLWRDRLGSGALIDGTFEKLHEDGDVVACIWGLGFGIVGTSESESVSGDGEEGKEDPGMEGA